MITQTDLPAQPDEEKEIMRRLLVHGM